MDIVINIQSNSKQYKKSIVIELSDRNNFHLFIPKGFAHGFIAIDNDSKVYYAVDNFCPHMGAPLCEGELVGSDLWCPFHGASFDVKTGDVLTPPAYENLKCFPVRLTDEGIEIEI